MLLARLLHIRLLLVLLMVLWRPLILLLLGMLLPIEVVELARVLGVRAVLGIAVVEAILPLTRVAADVDRRLLSLDLVASLVIVIVIVGLVVAELVVDAASVVVIRSIVVAAASLMVGRLILSLRVVSSL